MLARVTPFKAGDKMAIYRRIITEPVRFPTDFPSRSGRALIRALLHKDPNMRLGTTVEGVEGVKKHPFFDDLDWKKCAKRELTPPWTPVVADECDTRNFLTQGQDFSGAKDRLRGWPLSPMTHIDYTRRKHTDTRVNGTRRARL